MRKEKERPRNLVLYHLLFSTRISTAETNLENMLFFSCGTGTNSSLLTFAAFTPPPSALPTLSTYPALSSCSALAFS